MSTPTLQRTQANGIEICYEDRPGPAADSPVILLIMGLGCQLLHWPEDLVAALNTQARVIRFDNRDTGESTWMNGVRVHPTSTWDRVRWFMGARLPSPYSLEDMADDAVGLLDALNIPAAHIIGASMGGMIAQILGYRAPQRVQSLTLVMTTSGKRSKGLPQAKTLKVVTRRPASPDFEEVLQTSMNVWAALAGSDHPTPAEVAEFRLREILGRAQNPAGFLRHYAAIMNQPDRTPQLRSIRAPTLVLHGDTDPLVNVSGGKHLAKVIPGAKLQVIPGWGHDFPPSLTGTLSTAMLEHVHAAD